MENGISGGLIFSKIMGAVRADILFGTLGIQQALGAVDVREVQDFVVIFDFAGLVVVGVEAHIGFRRIELALEFRTADVAVRIEVAEIPVPRFHVAAALGSAAVGRVAREPAVRGDVELCPVVAADASASAVTGRMDRVAGESVGAGIGQGKIHFLPLWWCQNPG